MTETVTVVIPDGASIRVAGGVVNFYFATASADWRPGAAEALAAVIKGVEGGTKAVVSGFHDTTGDAAGNEQLAQKRAETVRDVLTGPGRAGRQGRAAEARRHHRHGQQRRGAPGRGQAGRLSAHSER